LSQLGFSPAERRGGRQAKRVPGSEWGFVLILAHDQLGLRDDRKRSQERRNEQGSEHEESFGHNQGSSFYQHSHHINNGPWEYGEMG
jgi:hypothetical protein